MSQAAILISGGVDSAALAFLERPSLAFSIDYGQRAASAEIEAAKAICGELAIELEVLRADCRCTGSGTMAGTPALTSSPSPEWWPFRNQLLATIAAPAALRKGVDRLLFGSVGTDNFHADGRKDFYMALDALVSLQEGSIRVEAPALSLSSVELVRKSGIPEALLGWTHSCHVGEFACGSCRGCVKRTGVLRDCGFDL